MDDVIPRKVHSHSPIEGILSLFRYPGNLRRYKRDGLVRSHKSDGTAESSRCKAHESLGMRRTYQYAAVTKDEAQRSPSALLRAVSMSNGRWAFYEAVKLEIGTLMITF